MKHRRLTISATTVVLLTTTAVIILAMHTRNAEVSKPPQYPTYFTYSVDEIKQVKKAQRQTLVASRDTVNNTHTKMFETIKFENTQPTLAARYYAYLLMAQNESFRLAENAGVRMDSISQTTDQINCIFFPSQCKEPDTSTSAEKVVANIVTQKIQERIAQDDAQTAIFVKDMKPMADKWYRLDVITPEAGAWKTWYISSPKDFLPPPPPSIGSTEDKLQIEAVKKAVKEITPEQRERVSYWAGGSNTVTPAGLWIKIANDYMNSREGVPFAKQVEVNAVLASALEDAVISCWNTKYTYQTDRPDMRDPSIKTIIQDPNFPSYVSGHSTISATAATILSYYFPENKEQWFSMATEARNSRLWAGIHFPIDNEEGFKMGERIGQAVVNYEMSKQSTK